LNIVFNDKKKVSWKNSANLFSLAKDQGVKSSIIGFYIPYDLLFYKYCDHIYNERHNIYNNSFTELLKFNLSKILRTFFIFPFEKIIEYIRIKRCFLVIHFNLSLEFIKFENAKKRYQTFMKKTKDIINDNSYKLCFFHWSLPHSPFFYNSKINDFVNKKSTYTENLALLDKTIKEIRLSMMKKKQWENSIIIITSDHQLRDNMNSLNNEEKEICKKREKHLIPFIVKIPNSKPCIYDKTFHACILKDMVLNMLQGKITNNKDLCEFIDENRIQ
jgi:hypothetical protein